AVLPPGVTEEAYQKMTPAQQKQVDPLVKWVARRLGPQWLSVTEPASIKINQQRSDATVTLDFPPMSTVSDDKWWQLEHVRDGFLAMAFAADGRHLGSASRDGTIRKWRTDTGMELPRSSSNGAEVSTPVFVNACAFSPNGKTLASVGADRTLRLWDADNGKE